MHYVARYEARHPKLKDDCEAEMINSYAPTKNVHTVAQRILRKRAFLMQLVSNAIDANAGNISNQQQERFLPVRLK